MLCVDVGTCVETLPALFKMVLQLPRVCLFVQQQHTRTHRETDRQRERETETERERQRERQTDRHKQTQTDTHSQATTLREQGKHKFIGGRVSSSISAAMVMGGVAISSSRLAARRAKNRFIIQVVGINLRKRGCDLC